MIKCKPIRSGKQTALLMLVFALLAVATGILSVYSVEIGVPAVVGRLGFGAVLAVALYYMIKYTLADYEYELTADTLSIIKTVGRKRTVMGALDLSMSVALVSKEEFKKDKKKHGSIDRNFNYRQNPFGSGMIYIFEFSDKLYSVDFEPNEPFVNSLFAAIDNCKHNKQ
ncbi:MAG: hypothetical protein IKC06_05965 [Clostridia bacterium]|nr:hypothetical protein [Clostridia bacterium]